MGVHFIFLPGVDLNVNAHQAEAFDILTREIALLHHCECKAIHLRHDHVHVLLMTPADSIIEAFVPHMLETTSEFLRSSAESLREFEWEEHVHVTLLPPWHIEILASFVRDQDRYHTHKSLAQELEEVFMPNAIAAPDVSEPN